MRLHLEPKILNKYADIDAELVSVEVPEIGLKLIGDKDIVTRRPYPNKQYQVACRKKGKKAISGFFIDVAEHLNYFTVITTWKTSEKDTLTHTVLYTVADNEHGAVSDNHILLNASSEYKSRYVGRIAADAPVNSQPRMDVIVDYGKHGRGDIVDITDTYSPSGSLTGRVERITVPTVEVDRLINHLASRADRTPLDDDAFVAIKGRG